MVKGWGDINNTLVDVSSPAGNKRAVNAATTDISGTGNKSIFSDTALHSGEWSGIFALEETVLDTLTDSTLLAGSWDGRTMATGTFIPGTFTAVKLTSGEVVAYE